MTEDDKQKDEQITPAGAVELDESKLDEASGGLLPASEIKFGGGPSIKLPEDRLSGDFHIKFRSQP